MTTATMMTAAAGVVVAAALGFQSGSEPPPPAIGSGHAAPAETGVPAVGVVRRVGGDLDAKVEVIVRKSAKAPEPTTGAAPLAPAPAGATSFEEFRCGASRIDTPLPVGYPFPTPPGAIDLKTYPSVRRAEFTGSIRADIGMNGGFWPLFQHIQRRKIEMTSPVEMDYPGLAGTKNAPDAPEPGRDVGEPAELTPERWTMSFLYRTPELGPVGEDGKVKIVDTAPVTVLAIGFTGAYGTSRVQRGLRDLELWLEENPQWDRAGEARALYYNGPDVRNRDKWGEVQLPVRPRAAAAEGGPAADAKSAPAPATPGELPR